MNEWDAYSAVLETYGTKLDNQNKLIITLLIFCGINLISGIVSIFVQFRLQSRETNIHKKNLKEEKNIEIQTILYDLLQEMTYIINDTNTLLTKVTDTERYIYSNNLFLSKDLKKCSYEICDYFKEVMTDWRKKDLKKETELLEKFKIIFHK